MKHEDFVERIVYLNNPSSVRATVEVERRNKDIPSVFQ